MKLAIILSLLVSSYPFAQTLWEKHPSNPVLQTGTPGFWDGIGVYSPSVVLVGSTYKMYYSGYNGVNYEIGLATSEDKINWNRHTSVPVLEYGPSASWDALYVTQPSVIFLNGIYRMWYTGWPGGGLETLKIGYAISSNGTGWNKYAFNPVLVPSTIGNWDPLGVFSPSVIYHNGIYHMWFTGHNGTETAIGYATSVDGINWNWYQGNPVLEGNSESWDKEVAHCKVLYIGGNFLMWYTGFNGDTARIGYAHSWDGVNWEKHTGNPVLDVEANSWEQHSLDEPDVFYDSSYLHMWYSGFDIINHSQIGYAYEITIDVNDIENVLPEDFKLFQNYPNPFNPVTKIKYYLPYRSYVTLIVFDVLGNEVATLVNEKKPTGSYEVEFNAVSLPSGIYFYRLQAGSFVETKKMILFK